MTYRNGFGTGDPTSSTSRNWSRLAAAADVGKLTIVAYRASCQACLRRCGPPKRSQVTPIEAPRPMLAAGKMVIACALAMMLLARDQGRMSDKRSYLAFLRMSHVRLFQMSHVLPLFYSILHLSI